MNRSDVISIPIFQLLDLLDATPPCGPILGMKDQIPNLLLRGLEAPDGDEFVVSHNSMLFRHSSWIVLLKHKGHTIDEITQNLTK